MIDEYYVPRRNEAAADATAMRPMSDLTSKGADAESPPLEWRQGKESFQVSGAEQERNLRVKEILGELVYKGLVPGSAVADFAGLPEDSKMRFALELLGPGEGVAAGKAMLTGALWPIVRKASKEASEQAARDAALKAEQEALREANRPAIGKRISDAPSVEPVRERGVLHNYAEGRPYNETDIRTPEESEALLRAKHAEINSRINAQPLPENIHIRSSEEAAAYQRSKDALAQHRANQLREREIAGARKDWNANQEFTQRKQAQADSAATDAARLWGILRNLQDR